jgi:2-amino-4-hydroxy-6-hydroxymethyldihydropteridine diphosphokinase
MEREPPEKCWVSGGLNSERVAIALGSNLGDREGAFTFAADHLARFVSNLTISRSIETDPEGEGLQDQPRYLNAVAVGDTFLNAGEVLRRLLEIEQSYGRARPYPGAPRTLDLDLILLGETVENSPGLSVPHPRFRRRYFVLAPLAEVAPDMRDPVTGLTVVELLERMKTETGS